MPPRNTTVTREKLEPLWLDPDLSLTAIAKMLNTTIPTLHSRSYDYGLPERRQKAQQQCSTCEHYADCRETEPLGEKLPCMVEWLQSDERAKDTNGYHRTTTMAEVASWFDK